MPWNLSYSHEPTCQVPGENPLFFKPTDSSMHIIPNPLVAKGCISVSLSLVSNFTSHHHQWCGRSPASYLGSWCPQFWRVLELFVVSYVPCRWLDLCLCRASQTLDTLDSTLCTSDPVEWSQNSACWLWQPLGLPLPSCPPPRAPGSAASPAPLLHLTLRTPCSMDELCLHLPSGAECFPPLPIEATSSDWCWGENWANTV